MSAKKSTAEMGLERLLRPGWNFEIDYDGQSGNIPIIFTWPTLATPLPVNTPDLSVVDDEARRDPPPTGISPLLSKFVPVSIGSTILIFVPIVPCDTSNWVDHWMYVWRIVFRYRSAADWIRDKRKRKPYQIGKTTLACPDTRGGFPPFRPNTPIGTVAVPGQRYLMPVTAEAVIYGKSEENFFPVGTPNAPTYGTLLPDAAGIPATGDIIGRTAIYPGSSLVAPGAEQYMDHQQGVLDPNFPGITPAVPIGRGFRPNQATHLTKWIKAAGNEFLIEVYKFNYVDPLLPQTFTPRAWDFNVDPVTHIPQPGAEDYPFSAMFGIGGLSSLPNAHQPSPYTGVRVVSGLAPL